MNEMLIGIIGSTGKIGSVVVNILKEKYKVRAGYRNNKLNLNNSENLTYEYVDITETKSLYDFCNGCSVILNCAGPSYIIKDKVAFIAQKVGAVYIDAYGTRELRNNLGKKGIIDKNLYILGTGVYPGLSGIFSMYMSKFCNNGIENYCGFTGNNEVIGRTAAIDLINSSASSFGIVNGYYKDKKIMIEHCNMDRELFIPYNVNCNVFLNEYLNEEILEFAKSKNVKCAKWYNMVKDREYTKILTKGYSLFAQHDNVADLNKLIDEFIEKASNIEKTWSLLVIEVEGYYDTKKVKKRGVIYNKSGYELSGIILALVTIQLLQYKADNKPIKNGVYWPHEIVDNEFIINQIKESNMKINVQIEDFEDSILENLFEEVGVI